MQYMGKGYRKEKELIAIGVFDIAIWGLGFEMDVVPLQYAEDIVFTPYHSFLTLHVNLSII